MTETFELLNKPSTSQYVAGLRALGDRITETHRTLLRTHHAFPLRAASSSDLARAAGIPGGHPVVNGLYGKLGRALAEELGITPELRPDSTYRWWSIWSRGYRKGKHFVWELHQEVADALEELGWVSGNDVSGATPDPSTSYYLYIWNPRKWDWTDLAIATSSVASQSAYQRQWSCGNSMRIKPGDVFFMIRLGEDPKGLIGAGQILTEPKEMSHWDRTKAAEGQTALGTELLFSTLDEEPLISLEALQMKYPEVRWTPQSSGLSIQREIGAELASELRRTRALTLSTAKGLQKYIEGQRRELTISTYDRSDAARRKCIERYGTRCHVCNFDFGLRYGDWGSGYIEVHHLNPLSEVSEEREIDPIADLRPVCSNCHRMLHRRRTTISLEELSEHYRPPKVTE